jgi:hydrogenase maturation protease
MEAFWMNSVVGDNSDSGCCTDGSRLKDAVLLIGYGNLLRSDDGVGPAIVSRLAERFAANPSIAGCRFLTVHQLTPELTDDLQHTDRVIFIDASVELKPGQVRIRRIPRPRPTEPANSAFAQPSLLGHHFSPEGLLSLSQSLYHGAPRAWTVAIGIANSAVGDRLSPPVCLAVARLSHLLAHRVRCWSRFSALSNASKEQCYVCQ